MSKVWCCGFDIQKIDEHFFQLFFGSDDIVNHALTAGPWNFENNLIQFRPWDEKRRVSAADMELEAFWVSYCRAALIVLHFRGGAQDRNYFPWMHRTSDP